MNQQLVNRTVLVAVVAVISFIFIGIIKPFLVAIFLAALFAALSHPIYQKLLHWLGHREVLASLLTLLLLICFVFIPVGLVAATAVSQALEIANFAKPWVQQQLATPGLITETLQSLPFYEQVEPFRDLFISQMGEFVGTLSKIMVDFFQAATVGTFNAVLMSFIILYTMFFFLIDGDRLLYYVLYYLPLSDDEEKQLLVRFTSVTQATLKGTAVIGLMQGALNGVAFAVAGIPSALFWAVAMVFLSVVPGIGTALVWLPAALYLVITGKFLAALLLFLFCAIFVGSLDNFLRPKLVGNDTQLHELLIFFSTLGGLLMFGFWGFVIGPIVAALFVTIWEIYGDEFAEWLPTTAYVPKSGPVDSPKNIPKRQQRKRKLAAENAQQGESDTTEKGATDVNHNQSGRSDT